MFRALLAGLAITLTLAVPSTASAHALTRHAARSGTERFMARVAWAFDVAQTGERVHVRPAPYCIRLSHVTVTCPVKLTLPSTGARLRGWVRVHRTRQGLLGYLLPWDPYVVRETLGHPARGDGVGLPVQVGVE